jgi:antitoxin (DNA-binding transcriptional repressor) of toxin-antitoxin stability system
MMRTMTATEVARGFRRVLDSLEHGGEEIVVVRNHQPVARLVPGAARVTALEALADLHRSLEDAEGEAWLGDLRGADRLLAREARDPWA